MNMPYEYVHVTVVAVPLKATEVGREFFFFFFFFFLLGGDWFRLPKVINKREQSKDDVMLTIGRVVTVMI